MRKSSREAAKVGGSMSLTPQAAAATQGAEGQDPGPRKQGPNLLTLFPTFSFPPGGGEKRRQLFLQKERRREMFALRAPMSECRPGFIFLF